MYNITKNYNGFSKNENGKIYLYREVCKKVT